MSDRREAVRAFSHLSEAWYGEACLRYTDEIDSVTMGFYYPDGGTDGEFSIVWKTLDKRAIPRLEAFDDSWSALHEFQDVIALLAERDGENITPRQLCNILRQHGIIDQTKRTRNEI